MYIQDLAHINAKNAGLLHEFLASKIVIVDALAMLVMEYLVSSHIIQPPKTKLSIKPMPKDLGGSDAKIESKGEEVSQPIEEASVSRMDSEIQLTDLMAAQELKGESAEANAHMPESEVLGCSEYCDLLL